MAILEQLVFGYRADEQPRRQILSRSPGLVGDCVQEIVRLCEGWGSPPAAGLRRPSLMSFPLATRLTNLPGELHAVIRVAPGLKPIFHALVLSRSDYFSFDLNPFALAQEDVFIADWDGDADLPRRELDPGCLAPLVAPPPGPADIGSVDEAVRQMLANQRLLLPLEQSSSDSDRFLALTIAGLPRQMRHDLRFASWAPSGTNRYTLAATYRESAPYSAWQPYLMTTVLGDLGPASAEYLAELQRCLRDGDLAGLERHSASGSADIGRAAHVVRHRPKVLSATVKEDTAVKTAHPEDRRSPVRAAAAPKTERGTPPKAELEPGSVRRQPRPYRPSDTGGLKRGLAVVLSLAILAAGGYYLWSASARPQAPSGPLSATGTHVENAARPVDVAALYRQLVADHQAAGQTGSASLSNDRRQRGLDQLAQAGQRLSGQGQTFLSDVDRHLDAGASARADAEAAGSGPESAAKLVADGRELARELRLVALAQVSLRERVDWRDLPALDAGRLQARFDSMLTRRQARGPLEPSLAEVHQLLRGVEQRTRQLQAVQTLEGLLQQKRWQPDWDQEGETAVDALFGVRSGHTRQLREDALLLIRFKRAEQATGVAARAFAVDYGPGSMRTPAVADIFPEIAARVSEAPPDGATPELLRATHDLYLTIARAAAPTAPAAEVAAACEELRLNRAASFDPATYGDHVARLRFRLLERLVASGVPESDLPAACFGDGPADEHLAFLSFLGAAPDATLWRLMGDTLTDPFLIRWARHQARNAAPATVAD